MGGDGPNRPRAKTTADEAMDIFVVRCSAAAARGGQGRAAAGCRAPVIVCRRWLEPPVARGRSARVRCLPRSPLSGLLQTGIQKSIMRSGLQESIPLGSPLGSNVSADPACGFRHETYHSQNALAFNKSPPKDKREGASDASVPLLNEVREAFDDVAEEHGVQEAPGEGPSALPLPRAPVLAARACLGRAMECLRWLREPWPVRAQRACAQ